MKANLKGKLTLSRTQPDNVILIRLVDDTSGVVVADIRLTAETLGMLLTGLSYLDCEYDLIGYELAGKARELKSVIYAMEIAYTPNAKDVLAWIADNNLLTIDGGWKCSLTSMNRVETKYIGDNLYNVTAPYTRYVETGAS